jgi:hypothetical protein
MVNLLPAASLPSCNKVAYFANVLSRVSALHDKDAIHCTVLGKLTLHSEICLDGDAFGVLGDALRDPPLDAA